MVETVLPIALFWTAAGLIVYTYLGYPLVLWLLTCWRGQPRLPELATTPLPFVSVIIAVYNEEAVIEAKLDNCAVCDYPAGRIEFLFGSDGSDDGTERVIQSRAAPNVRLFRFAARRGKAAVINDLVPQARGEILVFTDANTVFDEQAVRRLVRRFQEPCVGGVCGRLLLRRPHAPAGRLLADEANYWEFENLIKRLEGDLGLLAAANGAIYGIRRALFQPLPTTRPVADDLLMAAAVLEQRAAMVYEPTAVARESSSDNNRVEFVRKIRIGEVSYNSIPRLLPLLLPWRGEVAWMLWSHKLIRWVVPFLLLVLFAASLALWSLPFYRLGGLLQAAIYFGALAGYWLDGRRQLPGWLSVPYYFVGTNVALTLGFFRSLSRSTTGSWARIGR